MKKLLSCLLIIQTLFIQGITAPKTAHAENDGMIYFSGENAVIPKTNGGEWSIGERPEEVYADYDFSKNSGDFETVYGLWTVSGGKYIQSELSPGAAARTLLPQYFSDFTMEFDFTPISEDTKLMLFFGCTSLYEVCVGEIKADGSNIIIGDKEYPGNGHIEKDKIYHVKMISKNGNVTIYLNNETVNEQKNLTFPAGQIGIGCWNSKAEFDNFKVTAPDSLGGGTKLIQSSKERSEAYIEADGVSDNSFTARICADSFADGETGIIICSDGEKNGYYLGTDGKKAYVRLNKNGRKKTIAETDYKALSGKYYDYSAFVKGNEISFKINSSEILRVRDSEVSGSLYGIFSDNTSVCCAQMGWDNPEVIYSEDARLTDKIKTFTDIDSGYAEACGVVNGLGIVNGYSDSTFRGSSPFTVGEFYYALYKIIGIEPGKSENQAESIEFEKYISQAKKDGYAENADMQAEAPVNPEEMQKALIKILGYAVSDNKGEIYRLADSTGLTKGVNFSDNSIDRYNASRLLLNALTADRLKIKGSSGAVFTAEKSGSFLKDTFSAEKITGTVSETGFGCADENKPLTLDRNQIKTGDKTLVYGGNCKDLLGINIVCYAEFPDDDNNGNIIYIAPYKTKEIKIKASQLSGEHSKDRLSYLKSEDSKKENTQKLNPSAAVIYNGQFYTMLKSAPEDIFDIKNGTVTLIYNNNSALPDVIKVDCYVNYVVDTVSASNGIIYDKLGKEALKLDDENDNMILMKSGKKITVEDVRENDILSVSSPKSTDAYTIITVSDIEPVRGRLKTVRKNEIVVGRDSYDTSEDIDLSKYFVSDSLVIYFDFNYTAAYIKALTSEDYAYLIKAGYDEEDETVYFKMFTFENGKGKFIAQNGINVYFSDKTKIKYSKSNYKGLSAVIDEILSQSKIADKNNPSKITRYGTAVRYKMNEDGEIKELKFARNSLSCDLPERNTEFSCFYDSAVKNETAYYYSGLMNSKYRITADTKILNLFGNSLDMDSYQTVSQGSLRWDDYYESRIYDVDEEFKVKLLVIGNIQRGYDLPCSVVTDVRTAVDEKDNVCTEIEMYQGSQLITARATDLNMKCDSTAAYWFRNENTLITDLKPGDIIAYDVDSEGYIKEFKLIFKYVPGQEYYATSPRGWYWGTIPSTDMTLAYTGITRKTGSIFVFNSNNYSRPVIKNGAAYYVCENSKVKPAAFEDVKAGDSAAMIWKSAELNTVVIYR